jgi:hypothetical protein
VRKQKIKFVPLYQMDKSLLVEVKARIAKGEGKTVIRNGVEGIVARVFDW